MSERFTRLFALPESVYAEGSPVMVAAGALLRDNHTGRLLAQLKLRNIAPKELKAATVVIHPLNTSGECLGDGVKHTYLDLKLVRDGEFGQKQPAVMPHADTRGFTVEVTKVTFADNSCWQGIDAPWEPLAKVELLKKWLADEELLNQYWLEFGNHNIYAYSEHKDLWYCDCGAINRMEEKQCHCCATEGERFRNLDLDALRRNRDERLAFEEEKTRKEKAVAAARIKKGLIIAAIVIPIVIAGILGVRCFGEYQAEQQRLQAAYDRAVSLLESDMYDQAKAAFEDLGDFKDSQTQAENVENVRLEDGYLSAVELLETGYYTRAHDAFLELGDYRDSAAKAAEAEELYKEEVYQEALGLLSYGMNAKQEDNDRARNLLISIRGYKDTDEILSHFVWRIRYMKYDEYGRRIQDAGYTYTYNENGQIATKKTNQGDVYICEYNEDGELIRYYCAEKEDETLYTYDDEGRLTKEVRTYLSADKSKTLKIQITYAYNANGDVSKEVHSGNIEYTFRYDYCYAEGRIAEKIRYYSNKPYTGNKEEVNHYVYAYYPDGRIKTEETWKEGKTVDGTDLKLNHVIYTYYYNDRGEPERITLTNSSGEISVKQQWNYCYVYAPMAEPEE